MLVGMEPATRTVRPHRRAACALGLSLALLAPGCGRGPAAPGMQGATQTPEADAGLPPDTTETTAAVDGPSGSELTTPSVPAATGATPAAERATTSTTAIP